MKRNRQEKLGAKGHEVDAANQYLRALPRAKTDVQH